LNSMLAMQNKRPHYYMSAFGFQALAYAGPETGIKDRASYAVRQNKLTLVLTTRSGLITK
jgi:hypothetical protein